ncbi:MAG: triphosphoribosyl-dephospho-CoA synthase CitG [Clostridia bacterium]|nr:triphosphoribosyl-dephospho-CoA synthase CitG [Clostridia bacterium]
MNVTVTDMMQARESRAQMQRTLLETYGHTLLCFTMNIPGPVKDTPLIREGMALGEQLLRQGFLRLGIVPLHDLRREAVTGCEHFYVCPASPLTIKRLCADIEETLPVGRLFDMDVLRPDGRKVERSEIGLPGRKCLICGEDVRVCARARTHTVEKLQQKTEALLQAAITDDLCTTVARLATQALLTEILVTPKPGLVDRANSGSHSDMDIFTFAASTASLYPYYSQCARIGAETRNETPEAVFRRLRAPGRLAEGTMLEATGGVNTHRGAIFSLGILCAAAGRLGRRNWQMNALLSLTAEMTRGLTGQDFSGLTPETAVTFGQKLFLASGLRGVRGEAEAGFPLVRHHGYPALKRALADGLSLNDAGCAALISIMAENTDTNLIHRGGPERQKAVASAAAALLRDRSLTRSALEEMDRDLIRENLSPGGSADLLALTLMLYFLEEQP